MDRKIQELTEKIFQEGVEKGNEKAAEIIGDARARREAIIAEAKKEADAIIAGARKEADELRKNVTAELKLSGQQALSSLRQQITDVVTAKTVVEQARKTLADPNVIFDLVRLAVETWAGSGGGKAALEIILPEEKRRELEILFKNAVFGAFSKGLTVSFSRSLTGGFQIKPQGVSYKISMTDEDFSEFFLQFLRPRTRALLFG